MSLIEKRTRFLMHAALIGGFATLLLVLGISVVVVETGQDLVSLTGLGYLGIALLMFVSSLTILLPAPGFAAVIAAGALWNPLLVALAAAVGSAFGELSAYFVGSSGGTVLGLKGRRQWNSVHLWLDRYGFLAIVLLAITPFPPFDVVGLVAGSCSYGVRRFWLASLLGKLVKYVALAYLGGSIGTRWLPFAES